MSNLYAIHRRNRTRLFVIIAVLLSALFVLSYAVTAQEAGNNYEGKRVLLIDSYHEGYDWSDDIVETVTELLEAEGIELMVVHMNTKQVTDSEGREAAAEEVMAEIENFEPDLVIASDDNAQAYVIVPYLLDTDLPVIFIAVNWDASDYGYPASNVTGMIEVELVEQLMGQLGQYANGSQMGYLAVETETEIKALEVYQERFFDEDVQVYLVKTWEEYQEAFLEAQDTVDILILGNNAGIDEWDHEEAQAFFYANTDIPTGSVREWTAPYALISLAKVANEQGEWAAQTTLDIFNGVSIEDIPVVENERGLLILNLDIADELGIIFLPTMLRSADIYIADETEED
jgi:ABC-type uncharacterized transport system substrate-binding protein